MKNSNSKLVDSKVVYRGKFINVRIDSVEKNGKISEKEVIEANKGVIIAYILDSNKILLIKQQRHNRGTILELPAGAMKKDETPLQAAKRELVEETGIQAQSWKLISTHHNGVHQEGENYFFLAHGHVATKSQILDDDEHIDDMNFYDFDQIEFLMKKGSIPCLRTRACIWLVQLLLLKKHISQK